MEKYGKFFKIPNSLLFWLGKIHHLRQHLQHRQFSVAMTKVSSYFVIMQKSTILHDTNILNNLPILLQPALSCPNAWYLNLIYKEYNIFIYYLVTGNFTADILKTTTELDFHNIVNF